MLKGSSKSWFIEPLRYFDKQAGDNIYVVYETKDVIPHSGINCGVREIATRQITNTNARIEGTATGTCKMVEVAIASDDSMVYRYGSALKVQQHNIGVINTMVGLYGNTQLTGQYLEFRIVGQYVSTAQANNALSPLYTGQDATILLPNFMAWGQAGNFGFSYDLGVYWTTKNITDAGGNTGVIGLAYVGATCTSFKYQILEDLSLLSGAYLGVLAAHETGHNFGANHDADGDPYIMAPSIDNVTDFSAASIVSMDAYMASGSATCFSNCNTLMPVAQFNASNTSVCTNNSLTFTDFSVGQVTGVSWTFQDGTPATSTNRSQTVTFSTPGYKTITLTATNANGTNSVSKSILVSNSTHNSSGCYATNHGGAPDFGVLLSFLLQDLRYAPASPLAGVYTNKTCDNITVLRPGTTYPVFATIGYSGSFNWSNNLQLFIDYNDDGDFGDANEMIFTPPTCTAGGEIQFTFTTPATVPKMDAYLRMRVLTKDCTYSPKDGCFVPDNSSTTDFSVYFSSSAVLPLLLTSFDGYYSNGKNELNWQTETEANTDHFIIERSVDGSQYVEVGRVLAKGLGATRINSYQLTDALLNAQNVNRFFYRLKIVDKDGSYKYSKLVITTRPGGDNVQVLVYPNPVLRNNTLQIKKATNNMSVIEIYNSMGQRVYSKRVTASLYNVSVDVPANWSSGVYMIRITDNKESWSRSVMIK
jgi:PKD repeat protein